MFGSLLLLYMFAVVGVLAYLHGIRSYERQLTKPVAVRVAMVVFAPITVACTLLFLVGYVGFKAVVIATGGRRKLVRR